MNNLIKKNYSKKKKKEYDDITLNTWLNNTDNSKDELFLKNKNNDNELNYIEISYELWLEDKNKQILNLLEIKYKDKYKKIYPLKIYIIIIHYIL
jgi:hypothetical protein